jgi:hypothetical protein
VPEGRKYGFDDLMRDLLEVGRGVHIEQFYGCWLDIGRPDDSAGREDFDQWQDRLLPRV